MADTQIPPELHIEPPELGAQEKIAELEQARRLADRYRLEFLDMDTFLIDQAALGHPRNPRFLLEHYELLALLEGLQTLCYREGLTVYPDQTKAWRASALARRKDRN